MFVSGAEGLPLCLGSCWNSQPQCTGHPSQALWTCTGERRSSALSFCISSVNPAIKTTSNLVSLPSHLSLKSPQILPLKSHFYIAKWRRSEKGPKLRLHFVPFHFSTLLCVCEMTKHKEQISERWGQPLVFKQVL